MRSEISITGVHQNSLRNLPRRAFRTYLYDARSCKVEPQGLWAVLNLYLEVSLRLSPASVSVCNFSLMRAPDLKKEAPLCGFINRFAGRSDANYIYMGAFGPYGGPLYTWHP